MTDEHFSPSPSAPAPPTESDYEAIAAAVIGTVRGRWFLAEFAKRNRNADSALILEKLLQDAPALVPAVPPAERVRIDLRDGQGNRADSQRDRGNQCRVDPGRS